MSPNPRTEPRRPQVRIGAVVLAGLLLFQGGCLSSHAHRASQASHRADKGPPTPTPPPPAPILEAAPEAVYRNPKIGVVYLRAHQDTEGRLLGPQVMYQVIDPGGWNVEAVEQGKGYIPAVNLEVPPNQGSPYVVPAREVPALPPDAPLLDPAQAAQITITGFMRPEDKAAAEAKAREAGEGHVAAYDEQAGWLVLPDGKVANP